MKKIFILIFLVFWASSYAQSKRIYVVSDKLEPIIDFEIRTHKKDTLEVFKSNSSNSFVFNSRNVDSLIISYNSFYSEKLDLNLIRNKDTVIVKKIVHLNEVLVEESKRIELGALVKNREIGKLSTLGSSIGVIRIDVSDYIYSEIESISIFLFKGFYHSSYSSKRLSNKNREFEFLLFQSSELPDKDVVNLFNKPLIVNTEDVKKGWFTISLKSMSIKVKDLKYLFIGYRCLGEPMAVGTIKAKHLPNVLGFSSSTGSVKKIWWQSKVSVPAVKISIKQ